MVLEAKASGERYGVVSRVARQLGIEPETLRHWAAKAKVDEGLGPACPPRRRLRLAELEREVKEPRRANAILREASVFFAAELDRRQPK